MLQITITYVIGVAVTGTILMYVQTPRTVLAEAMTGVLALLWPILLAGLIVSSITKGVAFTVVDRVVMFLRNRHVAQQVVQEESE